jgi:hypothetical protein
MTHSERLRRWGQVSSALALQNDEQLSRAVNGAEQLGTGIGGTTMRLEVAGHTVFAKRLRLTDLERRPEHRLSTRNLFALPTFCQRNVGSPGVGAWRELAAHIMTSGWVVSGELENFPLMFHWRELEGAAAPGALPPPAELADVPGMVRYWEHCEAMGQRLRALADASASVVIFMEHLPWTLATWLDTHLAPGAKAAESAASLEAACAMVERGLNIDIPRMNASGLLHGDAHLGNILTDGHRLYFADLGLALSDRFALSPAELQYLNDNASLDQAYALTKWVNGLVKVWSPTPHTPLERMELVRRVAQGQAVPLLIPGVPGCVEAAIQRHAPLATLVNDFYVQLHGTGRNATYPREGVDRLLSSASASRMHGLNPSAQTT